MNPEEKIRLQKQYALVSDAQILNMIKDGPSAYVEGAFALVLEEARRRRLEASQEIDEQPAEPEEAQSSACPAEAVTFLELAVINSLRDKEFVRSALDATDIAYNFLNLHIRKELELPAALLVDQARLEDAVKALEGFVPEASIPLW